MSTNSHVSFRWEKKCSITGYSHPTVTDCEMFTISGERDSLHLTLTRMQTEHIAAFLVGYLAELADRPEKSENAGQ